MSIKTWEARLAWLTEGAVATTDDVASAMLDEINELRTAIANRSPLTDDDLEDIAIVSDKGNLYDLRLAIEAAYNAKALA